MKRRQPKSAAVLLIGLRIEVARRARDLTLQQVATALNVSNQLVSQWESGFGDAPIAKLSQLLNVTEAFLLRGDHDRQAALQKIIDDRELGVKDRRDAERQRRAEEKRAQLREAAKKTKAALDKIEAARATAEWHAKLCFICETRQGDWVIAGRFACRPCIGE